MVLVDEAKTQPYKAQVLARVVAGGLCCTAASLGEVTPHEMFS